jgi:DNA topoisomerase I
MKLIIVESPTKARTIGKYLGDGYIVMASAGHIRDLPKSPLSIDVDNNYKPTYVIPETKEKVVKELKKAAKKADQIIIATDLDREGEAIGYHVKYLISQDLKGKKKPEFLRATFHEITKDAILKALEKPGKINLDLVHAQQARRVLDRLVGYKLSPVLWKKVRRFLSAGRVQSVAVKLIVEREREIDAFKPDEYWEIGALVAQKKNKNDFQIDLTKIKGKKAVVSNTKQATGIVSDLEKADYVVSDIKKREVKSGPMPPFITSTMQRAAANVFGWSSKKTMREAQMLYERGYITYHRTDSVFLSGQALTMSREYIEEKFGKEYLPEKPRMFKTKSKLAQEAHEAIRITKVKQSLEKVEGKCKSGGLKLYQLIMNRFLASQMAEAIVAKTTIIVQASDYELRAVGEIQRFDGWRKVMGKQLEDKLLPEVEKGEELDLNKVLSEQKFTKPPARYSESALIKALEMRGIGRPSTYAPTISTILSRQYVEKLEGRSFKPTAIGETVTKFLQKHFEKVMDYEFTAKIENDLDEVASGKVKWEPMIDEFYKPFIIKVKDVEKNAERMQVEVEKTGKKCPKCKKGDVIIRTGRFGKFYACNKFPDCDFRENYTEKIKGVMCPLCHKGDVILRKTRKGRQFFGCKRYPECDWASWTKPKKGEKVDPVKYKEKQKKMKAKSEKIKAKKK